MVKRVSARSEDYAHVAAEQFKLLPEILFQVSTIVIGNRVNVIAVHDHNRRIATPLVSILQLDRAAL